MVLHRIAPSLLFAATLAGCYGMGYGTADAGAGTAAEAGSGGGTGTVDASPPRSGAPTGLPCDIQAILQSHCTGCHSDPPAEGPMGLVTYADLTRAAVTDPTQTVAEMCVARMQSTSAPMPPAPGSPVPAEDIATFQSWVSSGTPTGSCAPADGGGASGSGNPYGTPLTCTSGTTWHGEEGPNMQPGGACIRCHASAEDDAPRFAIAGTVYPTAHEPLDCEGQTGVSVVISDAAGRTMSLLSNSAGNFFAGVP